MIKEYFKPTTVAAAVELKRNYGDGVSYLGGGTKINSGSSAGDIDKVISLEYLSLRDVEADGSNIKIGSQVTLQEIVDDASLPKALRDSAKNTFSRILRNMSTIGGSIGTGKTDSYIVPSMIALNAGVNTFDEGKISVEDYVTKGSKSLILNFTLPNVKGNCVTRKVSRSCNSLPVINVATRLVMNGDNVSEAVIAVAGVSDSIVRLKSIEEGLLSGTIKTQEDIEKKVSLIVEPKSDIVGSVEYKKYITGVTVADCIEICKKGEDA